MRQVIPGTAGSELIEDRVDDLPHIHFAVASSRFLGWHKRLQDGPLLVRQVTLVGFSRSHTHGITPYNKPQNSFLLLILCARPFSDSLSEWPGEQRKQGLCCAVTLTAEWETNPGLPFPGPPWLLCGCK